MPTINATRRIILSAFNQFDLNLNLDPDTRSQAQTRWNELADLLQRSGLARSTFLQGSFARKTMLVPLKDVDVVVLLSDSLTQEARLGPNPPLAAMQRFASAIRPAFPTAKFETSKHALQITFADVEFGVDLVPALDGPNQYVQIGNTETSGWDSSSVRILTASISERNQDCAGRFVHQVRMAKALSRNCHVLDELKGITIESLCYACVRTDEEHDDAVLKFLQHARNAVFGPIYDPTGEDDLTVKHDWTPQLRVSLAREFEAAYIEAREAIAATEAGDASGAHAMWHRLIGSDFPAPTPRTELGLAQILASGSVSTSGVASPTPVGSTRLKPMRAWGGQG